MREASERAKVYLAAGYALLMLLLVLGGMVDHAATCGVYASPLP